MIKSILRTVRQSINVIKTEKHRKNIHCCIDKSARVTRTVLGVYVNIAHHAEVVDSSIGKRTSIGRYSKIRDSEIGAYCSISWDVTIGAVSHPMNRITSHAFTYRKQFGIVNRDEYYPIDKTYVGNDVWIGCGSIILAGVRIGDGAVIGAGAVVTRDVEPYSIVVGMPAKCIRKRFSTDIIEELQCLSWWNWDDSRLKDNLEILKKDISIEEIKRLKD